MACMYALSANAARAPTGLQAPPTLHVRNDQFVQEAVWERRLHQVEGMVSVLGTNNGGLQTALMGQHALFTCRKLCGRGGCSRQRG